MDEKTLKYIKEVLRKERESRKQELLDVIERGFDDNVVEKCVEKYRTAHLVAFEFEKNGNSDG